MSAIKNKIQNYFIDLGMTISKAEAYSDLIDTVIDSEKEEQFNKRINLLKDTIANNEITKTDKFVEYITKESRQINAMYEEIFTKTNNSCILKDLGNKYENEKDLVYQTGHKGYTLKHYTSIANNLNGICNGIHIIAADPNVGKTALLSSLAIDILRSNKHANVVFYTVDDEKDSIYNRMLAICANKPINVVNKKRNDVDKEAVDKAYVEFIGYAEHKRIDIYDSSSFNTAQQLVDHIIEKRTQIENLVVFVDGPTNLQMKGKNIEERHTNLALLFKDVWKPANDMPAIPVIMSNELRKREANVKPLKSHIKGSSKWEYIADSIILLYADNEEEFNRKINSKVVLNFDKNKFGSEKGFVTMEFKPELSKFLESEWS